MDSFEWNKIAGAVLAAFLVIMGISTLGGDLFTKHKPEKPVYEIQGVEAEGGASPTATAVAYDLGTLLKTADPAKGEAAFKKCATCHSIEKGGAAKTGPNLWGIVGSHHAHMNGFAYSEAMKAKAAEVWTFALLDQYIENPKAAIPGNKMSFAGLSRPEDRAHILAYLNKNSDSPLPYPEAKPLPVAAAPSEAAPAPTPQPAADAPFFASLVAGASAEKGAQTFKKCAVCHTVEKGGANKTGPNLWGIVGSHHAHMANFNYSGSLKSKNADIWSIDALNAYLENPKAAIPGNKMAFAGLSKAEDRAAVIAYLNRNSDQPLSLK